MKQSEAMSAIWTKKQGLRGEDIAKYLRERGVLPIQELISEYGAIQKVFSLCRDKLIRIHLKWAGGGGIGSNLGGSRFIRTEYLGKTFVGCKEDRTSLVRFFMKIFRDDIKLSKYDARAINHWLKSFGFSRAEKVAVITSLGYKYSTLEHMKIDGYLNIGQHQLFNCSHCQEKVKAKWKFCPSCGGKL